MQVEAIAIVIAGYLAGSIDFGVILPRLRGVDIYSKGSGNPGATNVLRSMGRKWATLVVLGDLSKGLFSAMAGDLIVSEATGFAAGFAAVLGHCFPVWHRFRGGKGVAAAGGMTIWMEPAAGLAFMVAWSGIVGVGRRASIASIVCASALVPLLAAFGHRGWSLVWAGAASLLVVGRHHANIRRLIGGSEHRIEEPA
ncbi:MAG TPA: glycerol-3-phosphate 1-O-acyltransferase PlsY [Acidimicrobiia bacterium]|nr:glycerol-3-phosphate 1-O-acyltransferase PlsY [Acidimicrobiia bacterium]